MGGGALNSTGRDYLTFLRALLGNGKLGNAQILKPETVPLVNKNSMGDLNVTLLKTAQPDLTNDAEFFPGMIKKWCLAYMINTQDVPGRRSAGSLAWAGLANTYFWLDPKKKVTGVVLMEILPFADGKKLESAEQLRERRLPERPSASGGQGRIALGARRCGRLAHASLPGLSGFSSAVGLSSQAPLASDNRQTVAAGWAILEASSLGEKRCRTRHTEPSAPTSRKR